MQPMQLAAISQPLQPVLFVQGPYSSMHGHAAPCLHRNAVVAAAGSSAASTKLQRVIAKIDAMNSQDPRKTTVGGREVGYELAYSQWMTQWVEQLTADGNPPASDEVLIAARGQHIARWTSPRSSYPEGKAAYLKWREDLKKFHSSTVAGFMREEGYGEDAVAKTVAIMLKKNIKEPEGQVVEDALCLVFLQHQFGEFRAKESEDKMVDILRKTWKKMGAKGQAEALKLPLGPEEARLVGLALNGPAPAADKQ